MAFDLVIRGGTVIDGSGGEPVVQDVGIDGDRIAAVGLRLGPGREEIDAPADRDPRLRRHPHALRRPDHLGEPASPSSGHGVTTVVMGNCGVGFAPSRPSTARRWSS